MLCKTISGLSSCPSFLKFRNKIIFLKEKGFYKKINPKPDSILRVFMVYKPLKKLVNIEKQEIKSFERNGFTVIEWGGTKAE